MAPHHPMYNGCALMREKHEWQHGAGFRPTRASAQDNEDEEWERVGSTRLIVWLGHGHARNEYVAAMQIPRVD